MFQLVALSEFFQIKHFNYFFNSLFDTIDSIDSANEKNKTYDGFDCEPFFDNDYKFSTPM